MSSAKLIEAKRAQAKSLMEMFMVSDSTITKRKIREDIHNLWEEVRLLQLEQKIPKKDGSSN